MTNYGSQAGLDGPVFVSPHLDGIVAYEEDMMDDNETYRQAIRVCEALMALSLDFGL